MLSILLKHDQSIDYHFHERQNYIDAGAMISCNNLHLNTEVAKNFVMRYPEKYAADRYFSDVSDQDLIQRREAALRIGSSRSPKLVGIYFEGYYIRNDSFHKQDVIDRGRCYENRLIDFLCKYIAENEKILFKIYPHYARDVETLSSASAFYSDLLSLENCSLNYPGTPSSAEFSCVDLGVCIRSEIFLGQSL